MTVDGDALDFLETLLAAFAFRAYDGDPIAGRRERARFLPDAPIERAWQVLHDDEDPPPRALARHAPHDLFVALHDCSVTSIRPGTGRDARRDRPAPPHRAGVVRAGCVRRAPAASPGSSCRRPALRRPSPATADRRSSTKLYAGCSLR